MKTSVSIMNSKEQIWFGDYPFKLARGDRLSLNNRPYQVMEVFFVLEPAKLQKVFVDPR